MRKKILIVDTDPGVDDALALFFLSQAKNVDVKLIVASAGNRGVDSTFQNAVYLAKRFKINAPCVCGATQPIKRELKDAGYIHGKMGLGEFVYKSEKMPINMDYESEIKKVLDRYKKVTYLCVGPLSTFASFILSNPEYTKKVKELIFMGGVKDKVIKGIVYKEFNVGTDPEAVEEVLKSPIKLTLVPSELGHFAYFTPEDVERIGKENQIGKDFKTMFTGYFDRMVQKGDVATHDACVSAYVINKKFFKEEKARVKVEYFDEIGTGALTNSIGEEKKVNAKLVVDVNKDKFKEMFFRFLKNFKE